ncbi:MAG: aspartyl/glutamyl-tRNA amidotransferase subunit A [Thiotrichales bacterium 32-46-8]|nr:Asp-tRNA(Asn)/Glu-tRNA(Gln) amidotransferase subunit GatA [Gammaproteobacteria bacterium]OYX07536.1 MAG: aspartyl/glutamyl-tRNA amidotransferase subunit A [Thiotrichales bacterium 32-46-8]OYY22846.1 MAG: aspartyl/glutamyl-tRNA amidotransferase subunit A [Thiotrichales bacterium 35-46-9]OYZ06021.1 MAG: aspartyl/glutamyl-tRNA amidotransferase subunit A [Thiotrichales bacterium 16-46-22]OZA17280.1 MAG: aspartyl/glutamyl-tRNA amidotransferase subunit A [Thiotrichales bacterium 17-46-47]OZA98111
MNFHQMTMVQLAEQLRNKSVSSVELTQYFLDRMTQFDGQINSYITQTPELALAQAAAADARRAAGEDGLLLGMPLAHKDIFCTKDVITTCASKMLANFKAPYNATVVEKLNAAGMVTLGKVNMDEFAMGSTTENSAFGVTRNPWSLDAVPGGSSGGSAAALAAGLAPVATGTDTGGSIRQPAAFCGVTGIKPTYGSVSRYGMIAYASSLDQGGPMAKTAEDCAHLLSAMAGFDERDSTCAEGERPDYVTGLNDSVKGLRIGLPKEYFGEGLSPEVKAATMAVATELEKQGATLVEVSLPNTSAAMPAYYVIAPAEASSNLSRYDGVRFGHRCDNPKDLKDMYIRSRSEGFGAEVKRRIMVGAYVLSAGYYDAYYLKAQRVRRLIKQDFVDAFDQCDVILGPVAPTPAWKLGEKTADPTAMYLADIYTIPVNLAGLPAIALPAGFSAGLPVGVQLIGNYFSEPKLLNVAHQYQQATNHHIQMPAAFA